MNRSPRGRCRPSPAAKFTMRFNRLRVRPRALASPLSEDGVVDPPTRIEGGHWRKDLSTGGGSRDDWESCLAYERRGPEAHFLTRLRSDI